MTKEKELEKLLKPYLDANIKTDIPDEVAHGVRDTILAADNYDLYDEFIEVLKNNPISEDDPKKSYFEMLELTGVYLPKLEIVDDDVDVYEDDEDN